ncbi:hypothetical protein EJB05_33552, partial [Eragrostis curvula]
MGGLSDLDFSPGEKFQELAKSRFGISVSPAPTSSSDSEWHTVSRGKKSYAHAVSSGNKKWVPVRNQHSKNSERNVQSPNGTLPKRSVFQRLKFPNSYYQRNYAADFHSKNASVLGSSEGYFRSSVLSSSSVLSGANFKIRNPRNPEVSHVNAGNNGAHYDRDIRFAVGPASFMVI